jgi:hypothetical protein
MGIIQRDAEERINAKSEEIAKERYGREFNSLPAPMMMRVWIEAENTVYDQMDAELEAKKAEVRRNGNHFFDDLEVERRLGK